ncbi:MAG: hypothetical protein ACXVRJ_11335 [Gaiellaceae bacterium]
MKARLFVIALLGAALVALPTAALGSASHAATNSQSFPDSTGEDANAPDITSVDVSNTDAGLITFHIAISNRPAFTPDMIVLMFLDTDKKPTTGDTRSLGADYAIELDPGAIGLFKWDGTTFSAAPSQTSVTFGYDATGATIHVSAADLGGTKGINFGVDAISGITLDANGNDDFTNSHDDLAPDRGHGFFSYAVLTKLTLKQTAFTTSPKPAKAGARFTASLAATESDTAGPITKGTITCVATVKGVRLPATHSLANGIASCFWKLPKTAKGKTLFGKISVTVQGTTIVKSFSAKIT